MTEKIIIINKTYQPIQYCLDRVKAVIDLGRISDYGKSYCYVTRFKDNTIIAAQRNKVSDTFTIWEDNNG